MGLFDRFKSSHGKALPRAAEGTEGPRPVDVSTIRYSIPAVAADPINFLPVAAGTKGPSFHEDIWCQTEFVAASGIERLKADLAEFQLFEARHRVDHGWTAICARSRPRNVIVPGADALATIEGLFGVSRLAPPVLTTSSAVLGQVEGGFALMPSEGVLLHGLIDDTGITALGAILSIDDDMALTRVAHAVAAAVTEAAAGIFGGSGQRPALVAHVARDASK